MSNNVQPAGTQCPDCVRGIGHANCTPTPWCDVHGQYHPQCHPNEIAEVRQALALERIADALEVIAAHPAKWVAN